MAVDERLQKTRRVQYSLFIQIIEIETGEPPDERVMVLEAMQRLAPRDREIIVLARFHFRDQSELAEALGISPNAARTRLSRALTRLERILEAP